MRVQSWSGGDAPPPLPKGEGDKKGGEEREEGVKQRQQRTKEPSGLCMGSEHLTK